MAEVEPISSEMMILSAENETEGLTFKIYQPSKPNYNEPYEIVLQRPGMFWELQNKIIV